MIVAIFTEGLMHVVELFIMLGFLPKFYSMMALGSMGLMDLSGVIYFRTNLEKIIIMNLIQNL